MDKLQKAATLLFGGVVLGSVLLPRTWERVDAAVFARLDMLDEYLTRGVRKDPEIDRIYWDNKQKRQEKNSGW